MGKQLRLLGNVIFVPNVLKQMIETPSLAEMKWTQFSNNKKINENMSSSKAAVVVNLWAQRPFSVTTVTIFNITTLVNWAVQAVS